MKSEGNPHQGFKTQTGGSRSPSSKVDSVKLHWTWPSWTELHPRASVMSPLINNGVKHEIRGQLNFFADIAVIWPQSWSTGSKSTVKLAHLIGFPIYTAEASYLTDSIRNFLE